MLVAVKKKSMYTVSNRPFKLLANTRRGITQKVDPLETNSSSRESSKSGAHINMSLPRPVFNHHPVNGRKAQIQKVHQESFPPKYEELVQYIHETWKEYEVLKQSSDNKVPKVVCYQDNSANSQLANFVPFDLEGFWGERFLRNIQQST